MKYSKIIFIVLIVVSAFFVGMNFPGQEKTSYINNYHAPKEGFVLVKPTINDTTVFLSDDCYTVYFDVTEDQAFSITKGLEGALGARPLTHDIMKDILENFDIKITDIMIDRYNDEIYYATIYMQQGNKVLELDARPSDSIALSTRTGVPIYFKESILQERGVYTCQGNR